MQSFEYGVMEKTHIKKTKERIEKHLLRFKNRGREKRKETLLDYFLSWIQCQLIAHGK